MEPEQDERLKEAVEELPAAVTPNAVQPPPGEESDRPEDSAPLSTNESEAWLESLPDSPLLIMRRRGAPSQSGQSW